VLHYCLNPSDICCEDCIHEQLYCDSSDVKETSQLEGSGEGILLAHTSNNIQQKSMVNPMQRLKIKILYIVY